MIETGLLHQVKAISAAQRLELIGAVWDLMDAEGLPLDEDITVRLDESLPEPPVVPPQSQAVRPRDGQAHA